MWIPKLWDPGRSTMEEPERHDMDSPILPIEKSVQLHGLFQDCFTLAAMNQMSHLREVEPCYLPYYHDVRVFRTVLG